MQQPDLISTRTLRLKPYLCALPPELERCPNQNLGLRRYLLHPEQWLMRKGGQPTLLETAVSIPVILGDRANSLPPPEFIASHYFVLRPFLEDAYQDLAQLQTANPSNRELQQLTLPRFEAWLKEVTLYHVKTSAASPQTALATFRETEVYQDAVTWGMPRPGHPEGTIQDHIAAIETNIEKLRDRFDRLTYHKLRLLAHIHDTFKGNAQRYVEITHPESHASLAAHRLRRYSADQELIDMVQYHDEPYALYRRAQKGGDYEHRFDQLQEIISDWDTFLLFTICDTCLPGKSHQPLRWLLEQLQARSVTTTVDSSYLLPIPN